MDERKQRTVTAALVVVCLLLALSLTFNAVFFGQMQRLKNPEDESVVGTFLAGREWDVENSSYIVFQQDGSYVRYKQFEVLEEGDYLDEGQGFFALALAPGESGQGGRVVYNGSDEVVLVDAEGGAELFVRISETPTFINVHV